MSPNMQWLLVTIIALVVIGAIFYFGRDVTSNLGGGHSGAPATVEVVEPFDVGEAIAL